MYRARIITVFFVIWCTAGDLRVYKHPRGPGGPYTQRANIIMPYNHMCMQLD